MCHVSELLRSMSRRLPFHTTTPIIDDGSHNDYDLGLWRLLSPSKTPWITHTKSLTLRVTLLFGSTYIVLKNLKNGQTSCWLIGPSIVSNTKSHHWCVEASFTKFIPNLVFGSKLGYDTKYHRPNPLLSSPYVVN